MARPQNRKRQRVDEPLSSRHRAFSKEDQDEKRNRSQRLGILGIPLRVLGRVVRDQFEPQGLDKKRGSK